MTFFFTPHARNCAKERYGFLPTVKELGQVLSACVAGEALLMRTRDDGAKIYRASLRGDYIYPMISADGNLIVTFMPKDFYLARVAKKHREEVSRQLGLTPCGHQRRGKEPRPYFRENRMSRLLDEDM